MLPLLEEVCCRCWLLQGGEPPLTHVAPTSALNPPALWHESSSVGSSFDDHAMPRHVLRPVHATASLQPRSADSVDEDPKHSPACFLVIYIVRLSETLVCEDTSSVCRLAG